MTRDARERQLKSSATTAVTRYNDVARRLTTAEEEVANQKDEMAMLRALFSTVRKTITGVAETILEEADVFGKIDGDTTASSDSAAALTALRRSSTSKNTQGERGESSGRK